MSSMVTAAKWEGRGGGAFLPLRSYAANIHIFMEKQEPN